MAASMLFGALGVTAAFSTAYFTVRASSAEARKRWAALASQGEEPSLGGLALWRLRNGFALLRPVARAGMRAGKVRQLMEDVAESCEARGYATDAESLSTVVLAATAALAALSAAVTGGPVGAVAVPMCALAVLAVFVGNDRDKRNDAVRDSVPAALESMSACFGSGFTLLQTFQQVAKDVPGALGSTFARSAHILEMGGSAESALAELRDGSHASELAFVAVALDVQHQSGGAMKQVLDAATDTVKGELALRRSLRVQTAQAKLSARVVAIMPFILVAAFSLASPDFLSPFFSGPVGYALLSLAIVMQVSGVVLVRRALAVDGVA